MGAEDYKALSDKIDDLRTDMDARFERVDKRLDGVDKRLDGLEAKMLPATWMIASVLVPLGAVALAFIGACAVVIFGN